MLPSGYPQAGQDRNGAMVRGASATKPLIHLPPPTIVVVGFSLGPNASLKVKLLVPSTQTATVDRTGPNCGRNVERFFAEHCGFYEHQRAARTLTIRCQASDQAVPLCCYHSLPRRSSCAPSSRL